MIRVIALASRPLRASVLAARTTSAVTRSVKVVVKSVEFCRTRMPKVFDRYHPEQHYMRGPGPKWREKHREADTGLQA